MIEWREWVKPFQQLRKAHMPSSAEVVGEAVKRINLPSLPAREIRVRFNRLLRELFETTLVVLEEYEERIDADVVLPQLVNEFLKEHPDVTTTEDFIRKAFPALKAYFLSIRQSRMARGGRDFELQIKHLLQLAEIPFEAQPRRQRADFILPSASYLEQHKPTAIILSVKRTLRERWGEVVEELLRFTCPNVYLATAESRKARLHWKDCVSITST